MSRGQCAGAPSRTASTKEAPLCADADKHESLCECISESSQYLSKINVCLRSRGDRRHLPVRHPPQRLYVVAPSQFLQQRRK